MAKKSAKQETAELLKGVFKEITVYVSRKRTDGNYGSYECAYGATINVPDATTNVEELASSLDAYLTAAVAKSMKEKACGLLAPEEPPETIPQPAPEEEQKYLPMVGDEEGEYLTPTRIYIHQGKKAKVAFFHDEDKFKEDGAMAFGDVFKAIGISLPKLTAGENYKAEELNIVRAIVEQDGDRWKVARLEGKMG